MISEALILDQANMITFVMVDANYTEVPGLGATFTLEVSKAGGIFVASAGVKAEISDGWYSYTLTAAECDTIGPLSVLVTGAGCIQQNLEYVIQQRTAGCVDYTYTVTDSVTLLPIPDAEVWIATDLAMAHIVWSGTTDAFGVARDSFGNLPCLDAGSYFLRKHRVGYIDDDLPADIEVVP